jgi:hypothetical protein
MRRQAGEKNLLSPDAEHLALQQSNRTTTVPS